MSIAMIEADTADKYEWQDSETLKLCYEISGRFDALSDAINHFSVWRLEAMQAGFMPANFLTELTVVAAAISRCKSQARMPVGNLLRQIQSLLSGAAFPSKLEAELRGKIDLNRHTDQLREQITSLETKLAAINSRRAQLVVGKWERLSLALLADSREAFARTVQRDFVNYAKSLHGIVRALKQDAALGTVRSGGGAGSGTSAVGQSSSAPSKDSEEWAKRDRRLLTRAAAIVKMEREMQNRERKLKLAVTQLSEKRSAIAEEFAREKNRMEHEFEMRERDLLAKITEAQVGADSVPSIVLPAVTDLPEFIPEPGTRSDPSSAIEAPSSMAPWAADQLEAVSRADHWVASQRGDRASQSVSSDSAEPVSSQQVLNLWSHQTTDASTSMYYSSDEEDSFPIDNNAAIQYVDRKQSLKLVRSKANQRSCDIETEEQMLSDAEKQLLQASQIQTKSLEALAKQREARLALMNDKVMEQKYLAIQDQLQRLKVKEAELLEQQTVLNDSIAAYENLNSELEEQKKLQAAREQQLDEMDLDISRRMSQLKFRESEITRGINELAVKRKNFESETLAERENIETERERVRVDMAALMAEMSLEKRRQELLRLEAEHRQNIMKDFEESNRLQELRAELAQKEIDFQKHVEKASEVYTVEVRARMEQMEIEVQERMHAFGQQMEAKVLELAAREKVLEGQERPIMLAKEMEDIIATCEAKVRRNDKETARLKSWEEKLQYQSKELEVLGDALTQQLSNDEMKKMYLSMQAQYKEKLARLALAEKKGGVPSGSFKAEELALREDSVSVREKAVSIAEKNAAALGSVSSNVKQAQAMSRRHGMARRQAVVDGDATAIAMEARNLLQTPPARGENDIESDSVLPPLDSSARSSVVAEKVSNQPASDGKRRLASVSVPFAVSGSPVVQTQLPSQLFSAEAAQSIVSAVIQMGFSLEDQETFTAVLVEKVCAVLLRRSTETGSNTSKYIAGPEKLSGIDVQLMKASQKERVDIEARERALAKREQVLLAQAKEISERSRLLSQAEADAKDQRIKGLVAAEKLGRAHVQEVAAASSKLNSLAEDVRGTNDALMALLSGVQALTDIENGNRVTRDTARFDADLAVLNNHAQHLEIRGNQHADNFISVDSTVTPAAKQVSSASTGDWRASPAAAQLDDDQAELWDRLTTEQLEVLQGLYHTHSKALMVLLQHRRRVKRPDRIGGSDGVDPAIISRVRALTGAVLHHNELARLSMKAMEPATCRSPTLSKVDVSALSVSRTGKRADSVQMVPSNAFIPSGGGYITSSSPIGRRLIGTSNSDLEEIMGGSRRAAIRSVNFNSTIREV